MTRKNSLIDVTLRDAHQCLWATRMTTAMMAEIAPLLDNAGFEAIDLVGGAVFDVCVRYLREDPWERMRILSSWVKNTPLIVMTRGAKPVHVRVLSRRHRRTDGERIFANGIRYHTPYDALNDMRNMEVPVRAAKKVGLYTAGGVVYTLSPVHTDEYYARKIKRAGRARRRRDLHQGSERAADSRARAHAGAGPQGRLRHAAAASSFALPHRACPLHGASRHRTRRRHGAYGDLHSGQRRFASRHGKLHGERAARQGFRCRSIWRQSQEVAERLRYIAAREGKPLGHIVEHDAFHYEHQMPGGMISNLKSQLTPLGIAHRLPEVLEEAARVRHDLGYPIIVSPFAQFVMTQAVLNVMGKERYATVPDEVRKYVLGYYGEIAGPIDPNIFDRIAKGAAPTTARPGDLIEPGIPRVRRERGPFASDDDLLLAAFYSDGQYRALKAAGAIKTDYPLASTPLVHADKGDRVAARHPLVSHRQTPRSGSMTMTTPAIITVAITGAIPRKEDTPAVPVTPSEQIESTHEAYEAGASVAHIHVRNPDEVAELRPGIVRASRRRRRQALPRHDHSIFDRWPRPRTK